MKKIDIKKRVIIMSFLFSALIFSIILLSQFTSNKQEDVLPAKTEIQKIQAENLSYKGEEGKDALTLLRQNSLAEQDKSGMVISINDRKADAKLHEYWAFYVNGKLASVGPADYITKNEDAILWKIEKY